MNTALVTSPAEWAVVSAWSLLSDTGLTIDGAFDVLELARNHQVQFSQAEFFTLCCRAGRTTGPYLLLSAWNLRVISQEAVTASIASVWSMTEFPHKNLVQRDWLKLFGIAGFTVDGSPAQRPDKPVTLYRGCIRRRRGFAWSARREVAEWSLSGSVRTSPWEHWATTLRACMRPRFHPAPCYASPAPRVVRMKPST